MNSCVGFIIHSDAIDWRRRWMTPAHEQEAGRPNGAKVEAGALAGRAKPGGPSSTLLDERMIIEPAMGARFLIPVDEASSGSAIALLEPWADVEASYASRERATLAPGSCLLDILSQ